MQLKSLPWARASKFQYVIALVGALLITGVCWWYIFSFCKKPLTPIAFLIFNVFVLSGNSILCLIANHHFEGVSKKRSDLAYSISFFCYSCAFLVIVLFTYKIIPVLFFILSIVLLIAGVIASLFH